MHLRRDFNFRSDIGAEVVAHSGDWLGLGGGFDSIALEGSHFELTAEVCGLEPVLLTIIKVMEGRFSMTHFCRVLKGLSDIKRKFLIVVHVFCVFTVDDNLCCGLVDWTVGSFFGTPNTLVLLLHLALELRSLVLGNELLA